ncbi:hypothetical protein SLS62_007520 [Diatrype stigma]|uniref:Uncharacterized protein n=1 Tax=Diatrype stigma TaxID=117547 RepID=A0AAN9YQN1_9PEZI
MFYQDYQQLTIDQLLITDKTRRDKRNEGSRSTATIGNTAANPVAAARTRDATQIVVIGGPYSPPSSQGNSETGRRPIALDAELDEYQRTHPNNRIPDYVMCNNPRQGGGNAVLYRRDAIWAALRLARDVFAARGLSLEDLSCDGDEDLELSSSMGMSRNVDVHMMIATAMAKATTTMTFPRQVWPECFGLRRVPVGDASWGDAVYEVPLTARGWVEGQHPGNDRVWLDAGLNYLAVTTDRGEYEANVRQ